MVRRRKLHTEVESRESTESRRAWQNGGVRLLILGCIDIILTLPMGAFNLGDGIYGAATGGDFIFYPGWKAMHADWAPFSISYAELMPDGRFALIEQYMAVSTSIILGYALIALFGFARHAREIYANFFWTILGFSGKKRPERHRSMMDMESLQFKTKTNMMEYV